MKKITAIAIASLFSVTALIAVNTIETPITSHYSVDLERHASIDETEDTGYEFDSLHLA